MASDVVVPEVGELGMEVTFVRWLKAPGDDVAAGDPLFELDTDKSVMVVEAYASGRLVDLAVDEGDTVAPRQVVARLLAPGESDVRAPSPGPPDLHAPTSEPGRPTGAVLSSAVSAVGTGPAGMSPRARRAAARLGLDASSIRGTGPGGIVTEGDVRAAAAAGAANAVGTAAPDAQAPPDARAEPGSAAARPERARRAIAELTSTSWRTIPHFFLQLDADVEDGLALAKPTPLVCAALAQALTRHPECNLRWEGDAPVPRDAVDLGLLVDSPHGLLIAVLPDAQELDLADMADAVREAAERARRGKLSAVDMRSRSLTVSNLGMYPVDRFMAVIPAPDVLTLAVGRTRRVPSWDGERFVPRRAMGLTLSVDHRALDGAAAARLLATLQGVLADPAAAGLA